MEWLLVVIPAKAILYKTKGKRQRPQNEKLISKSKVKHIPGMVDVGNKKETNRIAKAQAVVKLKKEVIDLVKNRKVIKGDVLETSRMAGIMAAKKTHHLIPLCHPFLTSGGTGFSPTDVTPEATKNILDKEAPGVAEMIRAKSSAKTDFAYLSGGVAGIRKKTLIINFPGSPQGAKQSLDIISPILTHGMEVMKGKGKHIHDAKSR